MPEIRERIFSIFGFENNIDIDFEHYIWIHLFFKTKLESLNFSLHIWFINKFFYPEYLYEDESVLIKYKYLKKEEIENILNNLTSNLNPEDLFRKFFVYQILHLKIYFYNAKNEVFVKIKKLIEELRKNREILISFIYLLLQ